MSSALERKLQSDLVTALKAKDAVAASVIRMLKADIGTTAIRLKKRDLEEGEVIAVVQRHIKQHHDSIEQFSKGGRQDLVEKERAELAVLEGYLPKQLTDGELESMAAGVIQELGVTQKKDMGRAIKVVLEKAGGKVDGKRVSQVMQRLLP